MPYRRAVLGCLVWVAACGVGEGPPNREAPRSGAVEYALAIHGGAGTIDRTMEADRVEAYRQALGEALALGSDMLENGETGLDVVEAVVRWMEDDPLFNAGRGAVFTHEGTNEMDAAIMDGSTRACGSVTGVRRIKNPISLARAVMEHSPHVFFSGSGAEAFAERLGLEMVPEEYFFTERRWQNLQEALAQDREGSAEGHGTVGAVARDRHGHLAAATSTGGMTNKRFGRVGDVPVVGAGTYADDHTVAVSCTGHGEIFIRNSVSVRVSAMMEYGGSSLDEAVTEVVGAVLQPGDGGLIAVSSDGEIALAFNTAGMYRGAADSTGRFDVAIWD